VGLAWFRHVAALPAELLPLATVALGYLALSPAGSALQSYFLGAEIAPEPQPPQGEAEQT
jgi:hypothetical protein